jgi:YidC/Oxa1 family membrane protein insertase
MDSNNKNLVFAIFLMLGVYFLFMTFFQTPAELETGLVAVDQPEVIETKPRVSSTPDIAKNGWEQTRESVAAQDIFIETDLYSAVFSNVGARLKSFKLKNYSVTAEDPSLLVSVVNVERPDSATLRLQGHNGFSLNSEAIYTVVNESTNYRLRGQDQQRLVFNYTTPQGLVVEKAFILDSSSYSIGLDVKIENKGLNTLQGELELSLVQKWTEEDKPKESMVFAGTATYINDSIEQVEVDDIKDKKPVYGNNAVWTGFENKYFMSALVPLDPFTDIRVQNFSGLIENTISTPSLSLDSGRSFTYSFLSYFGPRDKAVLETVGHNLAKAINYGFFDPIASPLMTVLNYFYSIFGNYGVAIILLTVIIKLIFWPLTHKSYASMKSMQKLKPEMDKIKERFKNDRARQGQETMALYKEHRVNPMGGCLPMIIQIPVFFALYKSLYQAIELRHAPFMFWITDLSAADTLFSDALGLGFALGPLPLIMGFTMFLQQKMTPVAGDPNMAKMMLWMPVVFTFLFLGFPSGLVIYWLINNVLTIVQQYYIHRTMS